MKKADKNIREAKAHPIDPDQFLDVKYSSKAGRLGFMAAVVLEDGFVANFPVDLINFRPSEAEFSRSPSDTIEEIEYANRRRFRGHGLNSENVYA